LTFIIKNGLAAFVLYSHGNSLFLYGGEKEEGKKKEKRERMNKGNKKKKRKDGKKSGLFLNWHANLTPRNKRKNKGFWGLYKPRNKIVPSF
jgi:hypothetical protein